MKVAFRSITATQWEIRRATGGSNGGTLSVGWHNMVVSQDGTEVKVYVDSVLLTTFDGTPVDKSKWMESNLDNGRIGCDSVSGNGNANFFTGNLMEIGLWNVALTSTQVTSLYNEVDGVAVGRLASTIPTGLRAYYSGNSSPATNDAVAVYPSLPNGTIFNETDVYKYFMFDGTDTWNQMVSS